MKHQKITISLIFVWLFSLTNAQICDLPEFKKYDLKSPGLFHGWEDTILGKQQLFWPNGKLKLKNRRLTDSTLLREEFYENGSIKIKAVAKQVWSSDTIMTISPISGRDSTWLIEGYFDIPHGIYEEHSEDGSWKSRGIMKNGEQTAKWICNREDGSKIIGYFEDGFLSGPFTQFYPSEDSTQQFIHWHGQYKLATIEESRIQISPINGEWEIKTYSPTKSIPVGTWTKYDLEGNVIRSITYEWYND